jgi:hypothetical protein
MSQNSNNREVKTGMFYPVLEEDGDIFIYCCGEDGPSTDMDARVLSVEVFGPSDEEDLKYAQELCDKLNAPASLPGPAAEIAALKAEVERLKALVAEAVNTMGSLVRGVTAMHEAISQGHIVVVRGQAYSRMMTRRAVAEDTLRKLTAEHAAKETQ